MKEGQFFSNIPVKPERPKIKGLVLFDTKYFAELEGTDGWIAIGQENCKNQRYFTVVDENDQKLGIVGLYDTDDEKNISHTVVDPKYRGLGLARLFKEKLLEVTGEDFYVATVSLDNAASLAAMAKIPGVKIDSDEEYELNFHKRKFRFERSEADKVNSQNDGAFV